MVIQLYTLIESMSKINSTGELLYRAKGSCSGSSILCHRHQRCNTRGNLHIRRWRSINRNGSFLHTFWASIWHDGQFSLLSSLENTTWYTQQKWLLHTYIHIRVFGILCKDRDCKTGQESRMELALAAIRDSVIFLASERTWKQTNRFPHIYLKEKPVIFERGKGAYLSIFTLLLLCLREDHGQCTFTFDLSSDVVRFLHQINRSCPWLTFTGLKATWRSI